MRRRSAGLAQRGAGIRPALGLRELPRLLENLPADQHAADFAGASADLIEFCVTQQAPSRKVVDVAVAAEALDGFERHPGRAFGGIEDGAGGIFAGGLAAVA